MLISRWPLTATIFASDLLCIPSQSQFGEFNLHTIWLQKPRPVASRPFKLTTEMEFFYAIILFNFFQGKANAPSCPCLCAPMQRWVYTKWDMDSHELLAGNLQLIVYSQYYRYLCCRFTQLIRCCLYVPKGFWSYSLDYAVSVQMACRPTTDVVSCGQCPVQCQRSVEHLQLRKSP